MTDFTDAQYTDEYIDQLADAFSEEMDKMEGRCPYARQVHGKGIGLEGYFDANVNGEDYLVPFLANGRTLFIKRESDGSPNPDMDSRKEAVRGDATRFLLPDGSYHDLIMNNAEQFPTDTPETFFELVHLSTPRAEGEGRLQRGKQILSFGWHHPDVLPPIAKQALQGAPASYSVIKSFSQHAYWVQKRNGEWQLVKYLIEPVDEPHTLSLLEKRQKSADYLHEEITQHLKQKEIKMKLIMVLSQPGCSVNNPHLLWPKDCPQVEMGIFTITKVMDDQMIVEKAAFDPMHVAAGMRCTRDPFLRLRSAVYKRSAAKRLAALAAKEAAEKQALEKETQEALEKEVDQ